MRNLTKVGLAGLLTLGLLGGSTAAFASVDRHQSKDVRRETTSIDKSTTASSGPELKSLDPASPDTHGSTDSSSKDVFSTDVRDR
jgi:hypothetical protein